MSYVDLEVSTEIPIACDVELSELPLREHLLGQVRYSSPRVSVPVRLNSNEASYPPPPAMVDEILDEIKQALGEAHRYPDEEETQLRSAFADYLAARSNVPLTADNIYVTNGSNEALQHVLLAFGGPGRAVLSFDPGYAAHPVIAAATGTAWLRVPRRGDLYVDCAAAIAMLRRCRAHVVVVSTPHNPTGQSVGLAQLAELLDAAPGLVVVDEAYAEFSDKPSAVRLLARYGNKLIITRTLSKAFPFAGGRLGYLIAAPALLQALSLVRLPYQLSSLTQAAGLILLRHSGYLRQRVGEVRRERTRLSQRLTQLGYQVLPSDANFLLFGGVVSTVDKALLWQGFALEGVLVRDVGIPGRLRVSIGTPEENDRFLAVAEQLGKLLV